MGDIFIRALNPTGEDVTDEVIGITEAITVDEVTYYRGFLTEYTDPTIFRTDDATYGIYTEAARAGTRYTVLDSGLPGANEVLIDLPSCAVIASSSVTLYATYRAYGRCIQSSDLLSEKTIQIIGNMDRGAADSVYRERIVGATSLTSMTVSSLWPAQENITFTLSRAAGETAGTETVTITTGQYDATDTFSGDFALAAGQHLCVAVDAQAAAIVNPMITFERG